MGQMSQPIAAHFRFTDSIMQLVLSDLDDTMARTRTRDGAGPSIAWTVGHVLNFRHYLLAMFGEGRANPFQERFGTTGATDGQDYPSLDELKTAWADSQREIDRALSNVSDETLQGPTTATWGGPAGDKTLLQDVNFLMWHEAYHMGSLGAIRTALGLKPTSELALAAGKQ